MLQTAITPAQDDTLYAYEFTTIETGSRAGSVTGRINPNRPEGQRVEILEATAEGADPQKIDERYEENADGDIWCDSIIAGVDGPVRDMGLANGLRIYQFTPKARPQADKNERKIFSKLTARVAIDESNHEMKSFSAVLGAPWKPNIVAKIHEFELAGECATAPNGRPYTISITTRIRGSAVGQNFASNSTRKITRLTPAS